MDENRLRFAFGANWRTYIEKMDDKRIATAKASLLELLAVPDLCGKTFLDIGCGSGLFSLSALQLGAAKVHSFDYDPQSVAATRSLKERYVGKNADWSIEHGDVLDPQYLHSLGTYDIVYSWGVLHHTGDMWKALENAGKAVQKHGILAIALYNDQGWRSTCWKFIKKTYNRLPGVLKYLVLLPAFARFWGPSFARDLLHLRPFRTMNEYLRNRGMSPWHDVVDWVGGYPFEVAKPDQVVEFFRTRGFALRKLKSCGGGHGNNEFVFEKYD